MQQHASIPRVEDDEGDVLLTDDRAPSGDLTSQIEALPEGRIAWAAPAGAEEFVQPIGVGPGLPLLDTLLPARGQDIGEGPGRQHDLHGPP